MRGTHRRLARLEKSLQTAQEAEAVIFRNSYLDEQGIEEYSTQYAVMISGQETGRVAHPDSGETDESFRQRMLAKSNSQAP